MNLIRYNPNRWYDFPINRLFGDFPGAAPGPAPAAEGWAPRVDIREEKDAVLLNAELPGVSKEDVKVELENGVLTITGEKRSETEENESGIYRSERVYGAFKRSFRVPETVDAEHIAADYADGVLKLRLPKRPEAAPRQIAISGPGAAKSIPA